MIAEPHGNLEGGMQSNISTVNISQSNIRKMSTWVRIHVTYA